MTAADLEALYGFSELRGLSLFTSRVEDGALKGLAGLKKLAFIDLQLTPVTDAGLKHLAPLTELENLNVALMRNVTGSGLKELAGCPN